MSRRLEDVITGLQSAGSLAELQGVITGLRDVFGVEHVVYHSINSTGQQYAALTYDPTWVDRYVAEDYSRIDPVVQGCFRRFHPVDWKRLDWSGKPARAFLGEALDSGVGNQGYSVPIRGPNGQFALFTVSDRVNDRQWEKFSSERVSDLLLTAHYINQRALELERGTDFHAGRALSPRELDTLSMLALGFNRAQAAEHLAISEHTFRVYVESARQKLGASNTTHAVARAIATGLIIV